MAARLLVCSAVCAISAPLAAQENVSGQESEADATVTEAQATAQGEVEREGGVEAIVVTAQRRSEDLQSVPIAIAAFSEETLTDFKVENTAQLMTLTPGLNISRANTASVPFLRGVGNFTATPGNEAAIATYVDDVYLPSPTASTYQFNTVERIEVLKGPQGTLFGRNAAGGVISITTKDPSFTPEVNVKVGYGNYATASGAFYASGGLSDTVAANIAVSAEKQFEGWGRNLVRNEDLYLSANLGVRGKVLFEPTDDWRIKFIADYNFNRNDASVALNIVPGTTSIKGFTTTEDFYDAALDTYSYGRQVQYGAAVRIDHEVDWATLTSISSYRRNIGLGLADLDASPVKRVTFDNRPDQKSLSQEFQVSSPSGSSISWIAGLYLFYDSASLDPTIQFNPAFGAYQDSTRVMYSKQDTYSIAPYGQITVPLGERTRLTGGLRWTSDTRSVDYSLEWLDGTVVTSGNPPSTTWQKLTWRASLDHEFTDDVLGYVSYNRGFKSGNYNLNGPASAPVFPMVLDAYEVGMKTELADHVVRLNWAAFYYKFNDLQVQQSISGGTIQSNAAAAEFLGGEAELTIAPSDDLTLFASVAYVDATYSDFDNATFNFPCSSSALPGCADSVNGGGYYRQSGDATGNQVIYAEKLAATLAATYTVSIGDASLRFNGSAAYHDGFYFDVQNTLRQPSHVLIDGSITYTTADQKWDFTLWGKNLADEKIYAQQQVNANSANYAPAPPLTYGITVGFHY